MHLSFIKVDESCRDGLVGKGACSKPADLSLIPRNPIVGENRFLNVVF